MRLAIAFGAMPRVDSKMVWPVKLPDWRIPWFVIAFCDLSSVGSIGLGFGAIEPVSVWGPDLSPHKALISESRYLASWVFHFRHCGTWPAFDWRHFLWYFIWESVGLIKVLADSRFSKYFGFFWTFWDKYLDIFNNFTQLDLSKWVILFFKKYKRIYTLQNIV